MRVAVVGAGVMGCATAWALRERGVDVTVHEQFALDHDRGSSHGRTRIFRIAYPDPYWIRFAQEAYAGWRELDPDLLGLYGLVELAPDPAIVERIAAWVRERLPDVDPSPVDAQTCLYTTTAEQNFVLERRGRVVVGSACSGHGFNFAPAIGRRLAELALS